MIITHHDHNRPPSPDRLRAAAVELSRRLAAMSCCSRPIVADRAGRVVLAVSLEDVAAAWELLPPVVEDPDAWPAGTHLVQLDVPPVDGRGGMAWQASLDDADDDADPADLLDELTDSQAEYVRRYGRTFADE